MKRRYAAVAALGIVFLALGGCATPAAPSSSSSGGGSTDTSPSGTVTVFAAASLTDVFETIADEFRSQNPSIKVVFSFAGSSDLVSQLIEGAPADVLASADQDNMKKAEDGGIIAGTPELFASNTLQIVVPTGNPSGVEDFADLARGNVKVVVCAPQVPCGAATEKVEQSTGTVLKPVSEESSVTDVLAKVTSGEADAGLVYVTDVERAGDAVEGISFDGADSARNLYPISATKDSANPEGAAAFIAFVQSSAGQKILADAGFAPAS